MIDTKRGVSSHSLGEFEARLPAGQWSIQHVAVREWRDAGEGPELILFSNLEPVKGDDIYSRDSIYMLEGIEVRLPAPPNATALELDFRPALEVIWPPRSDIPLSADVGAAALAWIPVEGASEYEVQISHVVHAGDMRYSPIILSRRVWGSSLPLASLPTQAATVPADEYTVHVFAFDAAGRLITESKEDDSHQHRFQLIGETRLANDSRRVGL